MKSLLLEEVFDKITWCFMVLVIIRDMFFELIFIIWILRSYYLWKTILEKGIYNRDSTSKGFYRKTKQHEKNVFDKIEEKRTVNNEELRDILTETGNLQRIMFEDFIKRLNMEKVENIAEVQEFSGRDDEDPVEWIRKFNRTADANNWKNEKKIAIAATRLKGIALEWYEREKENIQQWHEHENDNSFEEKFIKELTTETKRRKWMQEILEIKQEKEETVNMYEVRFKGLVKKVEDDIPEANRITLFTRGLLSEIYVLAVLGDRSTLEKMINNAKNAEISVNYKNNIMKMETLNKNRENTGKKKRKKKQQCYRCKRKGHISTECKE